MKIYEVKELWFRTLVWFSIIVDLTENILNLFTYPFGYVFNYGATFSFYLLKRRQRGYKR